MRIRMVATEKGDSVYNGNYCYEHSNSEEAPRWDPRPSGSWS